MNKKCVTLTVKFGGGNVMYWGGFSALGVGPLVEVKNTLKQSDYIHLLEKEFLTYSNENLPPGWYFQQDNASCHKGKKTMDWLIGRPNLQILALSRTCGASSKPESKKKNPKICKI